jgi:acyl-CoA dehydrogenase
MVLKHYDNQGRQSGDLPLVEWACRTLLYQAQEQLHGFLRNFPNRWVAALLRVCIFPRGRMYSAPPDELGQQIVALITRPTETRARLCDGIYAAPEPGCVIGQLQAALETGESLVALQQRLREATKAGLLPPGDFHEHIGQACSQGILSAEEAGQLREFDATVMALTAVDDFAPTELQCHPPASGS